MKMSLWDYFDVKFSYSRSEIIFCLINEHYFQSHTGPALRGASTLKRVRRWQWCFRQHLSLRELVRMMRARLVDFAGVQTHVDLG